MKPKDGSNVLGGSQSYATAEEFESPQLLSYELVGLIGLNCELFAGRSGYRRPVGDSRYTRDEPPARQGWRLVRCKGKPARPAILDCASPPLALAPHYLRLAPVEASGNPDCVIGTIRWPLSKTPHSPRTKPTPFGIQAPAQRRRSWRQRSGVRDARHRQDPRDVRHRTQTGGVRPIGAVHPRIPTRSRHAGCEARPGAAPDAQEARQLRSAGHRRPLVTCRRGPRSPGCCSP